MRDDTVEGRARVAEAVLASAELPEVLGRLGHDIVIKLEDDLAGILTVDGDVELVGACTNRRLVEMKEVDICAGQRTSLNGYER